MRQVVGRLHKTRVPKGGAPHQLPSSRQTHPACQTPAPVSPCLFSSSLARIHSPCPWSACPRLSCVQHSQAPGIHAVQSALPASRPPAGHRGGRCARHGAQCTGGGGRQGDVGDDGPCCSTAASWQETLSSVYGGEQACPGHTLNRCSMGAGWLQLVGCHWLALCRWRLRLAPKHTPSA